MEVLEKNARFYGNFEMKVLNYGLKKEFLDRHIGGYYEKGNINFYLSCFCKCIWK